MKRAMSDFFLTHEDNYPGEFPVCRQAGIWQLKNKLWTDETIMPRLHFSR